MTPLSLDPAFLVKVQETLTQTLAATEAQERVLAKVNPETPVTEPRWQAPLEAWPHCLPGLDNLAQRAAGNLAELDKLLAGEEEVLRAYLARTKDARRRLAEWAARAIG